MPSSHAEGNSGAMRGADSFFMRISLLADVLNELAKFFRPQRAVQAEPQHFARVALRQAAGALSRYGVRTCPDGPQEGPGQREHAGHLGVNIGLRPSVLAKASKFALYCRQNGSLRAAAN